MLTWWVLAEVSNNSLIIRIYNISARRSSLPAICACVLSLGVLPQVCTRSPWQVQKFNLAFLRPADLSLADTLSWLAQDMGAIHARLYFRCNNEPGTFCKHVIVINARYCLAFTERTQASELFIISGGKKRDIFGSHSWVIRICRLFDKCFPFFSEILLSASSILSRLVFLGCST